MADSDEAITTFLGISMATPCEACGHAANVHDGPTNAVKACITCSCKSFWLRCKAISPPREFGVVSDCELGVGHLGFHNAGGYAWSNARGEAAESARDQQVGGNHYKQFKIQPWDVIDEYGLTFYAGNALKYLLRAGRKGVALEDLRKARHYLDRMIEIEEEKEG